MFAYEIIRSTMNIKPTDSELEILKILWASNPASVREVHDELTKTKEAGYTTTLKIMQIMTEKGLLTRDTTGKSHTYQAAIPQQQVQGQILSKMIDTVFSGNAAQLVMQALGNHKTNKEKIQEIRKYLAELEQKREKKS